MLVIAALAACMGLTVAVLIALPINNAVELASTDIYAIYQASVTLFAALIAFQVFFRRKNSIFTVFIKAVDKRSLKESNGDQEKWKKWKKMSEKEKEIHLGDILLSHVHFEPHMPLAIESSVSISTQTTSPPTNTSNSTQTLETDDESASLTSTTSSIPPPAQSLLPQADEASETQVHTESSTENGSPSLFQSTTNLSPPYAQLQPEDNTTSASLTKEAELGHFSYLVTRRYYLFVDKKIAEY
jgi:hypothetical protein